MANEMQEFIPDPCELNKQDEEEQDFSASDSEYVPSEGDVSSGDSEAEITVKHIRVSQQTKSCQHLKTKKKIISAPNRVKTVVAKPVKAKSRKILKQIQNTYERISKQSSETPNSNRRTSILSEYPTSIPVNMDMSRIAQRLCTIMGLMDKINNIVKRIEPVNDDLNASFRNQTTLLPQEDSDENKENFNDFSMQEDFNKSGDIVLISNKYSNIADTETPTKIKVTGQIMTAAVDTIQNNSGESELNKTLNASQKTLQLQEESDKNKQKNNNATSMQEGNISENHELLTSSFVRTSPKEPKKTAKTPKQKKVVESEWIPIGGGATKVHKDQYKKVNWKTYTVATRTLLLAVFPRSILATHSLTGKPSPAFQNKPTKMALDQRKVADVVMEISDRFNISEGLVRNIITTKCADECKMMKMRNKKVKEKKT